MIAEAIATIGLAGLIYLLIRRFLPALPGGPGESKPSAFASMLHPAANAGQIDPALNRLFAQAEEHLRAGRFNEAELKLLEVERINPHYPRLYNRLGIVYLETGEPQKAVAAFEHAVLGDPSKAARHANLGMAYLKAKKYSLAQKALERAVEIDPGNAKYRRLLEEVKNR